VEGEALATLVVHQRRGTLPCAAVAEGVLPGGGVAFLRGLPALEEPLRPLAKNAGAEGSIVGHTVKEGTGAYGSTWPPILTRIRWPRA
jgi:chaperonin GroEL (HSP60 family)